MGMRAARRWISIIADLDCVERTSDSFWASHWSPSHQPRASPMSEARDLAAVVASSLRDWWDWVPPEGFEAWRRPWWKPIW